MLNFLLPDTLDLAGSGRARQARWALSTLIIAAPIYGGLLWWMDRDLARHPFKRVSGVRVVALGLMLTVAAMTFACDAVYTVYALLNGELTLRFALKAVTVALVAGGVMISLTGLFFDGTALPMIAAIALCAVGALALALMTLGRITRAQTVPAA